MVTAPVNIPFLQEARDRLISSLGTALKPVLGAVVPNPKDPTTWVPGPGELGAPVMGQVWPEARNALWQGWKAPLGRLAALYERLMGQGGAASIAPEAMGPLARTARRLGVLDEGLQLVDSLPQYHGLTVPVEVSGEWQGPTGTFGETRGEYLPQTDAVKVYGEPVSRIDEPGVVVNVLEHELAHSQQQPGRMLNPVLREYYTGRGQGSKRLGLMGFFIDSPDFASAVRQGGKKYLDYISNPSEVIARGVAHEITKQAFPATATLEDIYGPYNTLHYGGSWPKKLSPFWKELADALAQ